MKLIVGLGNPGQEYANTRHNAGFSVIRALLTAASDRGSTWREWRSNHLAQVQLRGRPVGLFMGDSVYMNESGAALANFLRHQADIQPQELLVIHDDLDLPFGRIQLKQGGGDGGHNGLKSVINHLGTTDFWRLRIGIGRPLEPGPTVTDYVLSEFGPAEQEHLAKIIDASVNFLLESFQRDPLQGGSIMVDET